MIVFSFFSSILVCFIVINGFSVFFFFDRKSSYVNILIHSLSFPFCCRFFFSFLLLFFCCMMLSFIVIYYYMQHFDFLVFGSVYIFMFVCYCFDCVENIHANKEINKYINKQIHV